MAGSKVEFSFKRLSEARKEFKTMALAMDPANKNQLPALYKQASAEIQTGLRSISIVIRDEARRGASAMRAPRRLFAGSRPAIFAFSDFDSARDDKRKRSVLVGMRTGLSSRAHDPHLYIRWGVGSKRREGGTVATGGLSMSLAALYERGTANGRIRPGHFFASALGSTESQSLRLLTLAYERAVDHLNQIK